MNFEKIFKDNISEFIKEIIKNIKDIPNFNSIINKENLEDKKYIFKFIEKKLYAVSNEIGL